MIKRDSDDIERGRYDNVIDLDLRRSAAEREAIHRASVYQKLEEIERRSSALIARLEEVIAYRRAQKALREQSARSFEA